MSSVIGCRSCGAELTTTFVDLGAQPLANEYPTDQREAMALERLPLGVRVCGRCFLVQAQDVATPDAIFSDYAYFSSYSDSWTEQAKRYAAWSIAELGLHAGSRVVEVASNDGYLLRHYVDAGVPVLGIEPAANVAAAAASAGVPTRVEFFGRDLADQLAAEGVAADLLVANNVLAHVPDIADFVDGLARVLVPTGVLSIEFPHLLDLIEQCQFDTIYHEHRSYLSLLAVESLLARSGLTAHDAIELPSHGGSLRVLAHRADGPRRPIGDGLASVRAEERRARLDDFVGYAGFPARVAACRASFLRFLADARSRGQVVAAYGAAAKGNTFLNHCGVGPDDVVLVADRSPRKQGRFLPGSGIPVGTPDDLADLAPDVVVILPWNIKDEVVAQLEPLRLRGTALVIAVPEVVRVA